MMRKYIKPSIKVNSFLTEQIMYNILSDQSKGMKPYYNDPLSGAEIHFNTGSANVLNSIDYSQFTTN